ncbi:MAG: hypothetical protein QM765_41240 [Myxococcales bacterium]
MSVATQASSTATVQWGQANSMHWASVMMVTAPQSQVCTPPPPILSMDHLQKVARSESVISSR